MPDDVLQYINTPHKALQVGKPMLITPHHQQREACLRCKWQHRGTTYRERVQGPTPWAALASQNENPLVGNGG